MGDLVETRQAELKKKHVCRFCLSQDAEKLTNIYSRENRMKTAPLPLQVMACVSIEVFSSDCMPTYVCYECRVIFDFCYRFKQMCKKVDTCLRHYPITGIWFTAMEKPKIPPEMIVKKRKVNPTSLNALQSLGTKSVPPLLEKIDLDSENLETMWTMIDDAQQSEMLEEEPMQLEPQPAPELEPEPEVEMKPKNHKKPVKSSKPSHKLLNKSAIRILNKEAQHVNEPRMTKPVLKRDNEGNIAIVTEILDPNDIIDVPDPVQSAAVLETNVFPCPHCERSFPLRQLLDIHMVNHNRERSFNCGECDKSFFSKYDLQKHLLVHTGEKPFKCVICNKGFTRSTLLHRHEKTHTDIPKFICIFCEKAFISQAEMERHTERHRKNRPFTCKICGKSFAFKQGLERHEVVHCRFQPFQCQYCEQSFPTPSKLSRHLTAHAGARPYPCKLCPKAYLLSHHLTRHMRSHKDGTGSYKCNDCDKSFSSRDDLIYHSAVHATQTLVCPLCKDAFEDIETVTEHIKEHADGEAFACEFCDLIFMTADRLQDHTDADHVDEMEAYNADEKANATDETQTEAKAVKLNDSSANREIDEVIEEYLIEEFSEAGANGSNTNTRVSSIIVKEETGWQTQTSDAGQTAESNNSSTEEDTESMVDESIDYINSIEMNETMETPAKVAKVSETVQLIRKTVPPSSTPLRHKPATKPPATTLHSKSLSPKENKKPMKKSPLAAIKIGAPTMPAPKTRQPTIQDALQGLPRTLSVKKLPLSSKPPEIVSKTKQPNKSVAPTTLLKKSLPTIATAIKSDAKVATTPVSAAATTKPPSETISRPLRQRSETSPNTTPSPQVKASTSASSSPEDIKKLLTKTSVLKKSPGSVGLGGEKKIVEMMIGDKRVKVQRITMSKAEAAAMAREGRIQMKEGTMILRKDPNSSFKGAKKST